MKTKNLILSILLASLFLMSACKKDVTGILISASNLSLKVDERVQLVATVSPKKAEEKTILWTSSDASIASVSNGLVLAISSGTAKITATSGDGGFAAVCTVFIPENVAGITIDQAVPIVKVGATKQLTVTISPSNATNTNVTWEILDSTIATISATGLLTGVSLGNTTVTVTTEDGKETATCEANVFNNGAISEIMTMGFLNTGSVGNGIDIAVDNTGMPFIALNKAVDSLDSKASAEVWEYNGSSWTLFGSSNVELTDDESYAPSITIADNGTVYVAYEYFNSETDPKYGNKVIAKSSGDAWSTLGTSTNNGLIMDETTALDGQSEMTIKEDGTLLVSLIKSGKGYVYYFNTSEDKWESYNGYKIGTSAFYVGGIDIQSYENKPYFSVRTGSGSGKIAIRDASATNGLYEAWGRLGSNISDTDNAQFQDAKVSESPLAISSTGDIYSCYKVGDEVKVKKFDGSDWETIYSYSDFSASINEVGIVISNDILYLVAANYGSGMEIHKYNATAEDWSIEGITPVIDTNYNMELIAGTNGEFFIAYEASDANSGKVGVYKYAPTK